MHKRLALIFGVGFTALAAFNALAQSSTPTPSASAQVAVAANFAKTAQTLARAFEARQPHKVVLAVGSTGRLAAQIQQGAPFDVLLSADQAVPQALVKSGHAVAGSQSTYAVGRLVLWSKQADAVDAKGEVLASAKLSRVAIADPKLAPYGQAAEQALKASGRWQNVQPQLVVADSVAQVFQFVSTGNASMGFLAQSQVFERGKLKEGSAWLVPQALHAPIAQDVVLLTRAAQNPAANAFLAYLKTPAAKALIAADGYEAAP